VQPEPQVAISLSATAVLQILTAPPAYLSGTYPAIPHGSKGRAGTGGLNAGKVLPYGYRYCCCSVSCTDWLPMGLRSAVHSLAVQEGN